MTFKQIACAGLATTLLMLFSLRAQAHDEHSDDLLFGRSVAPGISGPAGGVWITGPDPTRIYDYLATPKLLIPNVAGPAESGKLYFNLGTNVLVFFDGSTYKNVLSAAVLQCVDITPGLEVWRSSSRFFAYDPALTANNNRFHYPFLSNWHHHFGVRAFRPGTYTFVFKLTNVVARDGTPLNDSQEYTLTLRNRPVMNGLASLPGWARVDRTAYQIGNAARVYLFAANSSPIQESQALRTTDVYLDAEGSFQVPEGLPGVPDGNYRVGVKPLTAAGLARLVAGNVFLSVSSPPSVTIPDNPIGDINRDGIIDDEDFNTVVQNQGRTPGSPGYAPDSDVNGDGLVDDADYLLVVQSQGRIADFFP